MAIRFTMAKRGVLPEEKQVEEGVVRGLQPRLEQRQTVDVVRFQDERHWGSVLRGGDLAHALSAIRDIMMHEMREGNAVSLPGIGTFRLSLKGQVEVRDGKYHGREVRVDDILFQPERELREEMRRFKVIQVPYGAAIEAQEEDVETLLGELFARQETITHKDVLYAFELTLTKHRVTSLLNRLTAEGRLIREGNGAQTRYRAAAGQFGKL